MTTASLSTHPVPGNTGPTADPGDAHALLARNWHWVAVRAALAIAFGLIALLLPGPTMVSLVLLLAAYLLVDGAAAILSGMRAARRHERWLWFVLQGVADLALAVAAVLWPALTVMVFVWMIALWALLSGLLMLAAAAHLRRDHGRVWLALAGVLSVVWAALLAIAPIAGAVVLTLWLGAYALVFGISLLLLALGLRRRRGLGSASSR